MEENRQYKLMAEAAKEKLNGQTPEQAAERTGFSLNGEWLSAESLGIPFAIHWPDCSFVPRLNMWHELTILLYLAHAKGILPTGRFLSLGEFRSGGSARGVSFDRENDRILQRIGRDTPERIRAKAERLGGRELSEKSDLTFLFSFLPRVPVKLNLWLADDEFPASGKVLFDVCAEAELQVEAAGTAAGILLELLEQADC